LAQVGQQPIVTQIGQQPMVAEVGQLPTDVQTNVQSMDADFNLVDAIRGQVCQQVSEGVCDMELGSHGHVEDAVRDLDLVNRNPAQVE
jgi:hypothetical protein